MKINLLSPQFSKLHPKREVKQYWLGKTVIHSDHRFTYEEVQAIIEEKDRFICRRNTDIK